MLAGVTVAALVAGTSAQTAACVVCSLMSLRAQFVTIPFDRNPEEEAAATPGREGHATIIYWAPQPRSAHHLALIPDLASPNTNNTANAADTLFLRVIGNAVLGSGNSPCVAGLVGGCSWRQTEATH